MVGSFFYVSMDQVANQAAKLPYMSGGQVQLPIVYFTATGPSGSAAAQHSENPHPMLMNVGGLKIVMPSCPADAKGLMLSAIRDPNPVVYFQDFVLGGTKGPVPDGPYTVPIGVARVKRKGEDVTVVAIGALVNRALARRRSAGRARASRSRWWIPARWFRWIPKRSWSRCERPAGWWCATTRA